MKDSERKRIYNKHRAKQETQLSNAAMTTYDLNTGITIATDHAGRVGVGSSSDSIWGDCVRLEYMIEGQRGWFRSHFSPARARLIAQQLLMQAEFIEKRYGVKRIDEPNRFDNDLKLIPRNFKTKEEIDG